MGTAVWKVGSTTQDIVLSKTNGDFNDDNAVIDNQTPWTTAGYKDLLAQEKTNTAAFLFLAPQAFTDDKEKIIITYTVKTTASEKANGSTITNTISTDLYDFLPAGFESGKAYKLNLLIGMNAVNITASVVDWAAPTTHQIDVPANSYIVANSLTLAQEAVTDATGSLETLTVNVTQDAADNATAENVTKVGEDYYLQFTLKTTSPKTVNFELPAAPANVGDTTITGWVVNYEDNYPTDTVTVNAPEGTKVKIVAPTSHVEVTGTSYAEIIASTGSNTLVIPEGTTVEKLTINQGGLEIHGTVTSVSVSETAHDTNPVLIRDCEGLSASVYNILKDYIDTANGYFGEQEEGKDTYRIWNIVGKIGGTAYTTLAEAFEAVKSGETIKLSRNCETGSEYTIDSALALSKDNVTLDLNGKSLTVTNNFSFILAADGITLKNGNIVAGYCEEKESDIISYSVTVAAKEPNTFVNDVTLDGLNVTGGIRFGGDETADYKGGAKNGVVKNCNVEAGDYYCIWAEQNSTATVESGKFKDKDIYGCAVSINAGSTISLKGGIYSDPIVQYAADGYAAADNTDEDTKADYPYTIVKTVAKIGDAQYSSLAAAIAAVESDGTIQLTSDIAFGEFSTDAAITVNNEKSFTLDLNGRTISGTATKSGYSALMIVSKGTTLTIMDSGSNGSITYNSTQPDPNWGYGTYTIDNQGTLNLQSGSIVNTTVNGASYAVENHCNWTDADVTFNMSGGSLQCDNGDQALRLYANDGTDDVQKSIANITGGTIISGGIWTNDQRSNTGSPIELNISGSPVINGMLDFTGSHDHTTINISGGTFNCPKLRLRDSQSYSNTKPYANISGGTWTITTIENKNTNQVKTNTMSITGGTFNSDMDGFIASGYEAVQSGDTWTVSAKAN